MMPETKQIQQKLESISLQNKAKRDKLNEVAVRLLKVANRLNSF